MLTTHIGNVGKQFVYRHVGSSIGALFKADAPAPLVVTLVARMTTLGLATGAVCAMAAGEKATRRGKAVTAEKIKAAEMATG